MSLLQITAIVMGLQAAPIAAHNGPYLIEPVLARCSKDLAILTGTIDRSFVPPMLRGELHFAIFSVSVNFLLDRPASVTLSYGGIETRVTISFHERRRAKRPPIRMVCRSRLTRYGQ